MNNLPKVVTQLLPRVVSLYRQKLLLAHLMGEHCFAGWRLSSSFSVVVCNAAGGRAGRPAARRVDGLRAGGWARVRHCTAGQYGYVPLRRHLVCLAV